MAVLRYDIRIRTAHSRNAAGARSTRRFTTEDGPLAFLLHAEDVTDHVGRRSVFDLRSLDAVAPLRSCRSIPRAVHSELRYVKANMAQAA